MCVKTETISDSIGMNYPRYAALKPGLIGFHPTSYLAITRKIHHTDLLCSSQNKCC